MKIWYTETQRNFETKWEISNVEGILGTLDKQILNKVQKFVISKAMQYSIQDWSKRIQIST